MTALAVQAILLRHDDSVPLAPAAVAFPGPPPLTRTLRLDRAAVQPHLPAPGAVTWTSVPIESKVAADAVPDAWDAAHALVAQARSAGAPADTYAEPDLVYGLPPDAAIAATAVSSLSSARAGAWIPDWPPLASLVPKPPVDWFLDMSKLRQARAAVSTSLDAPFRVTVAHVDTGYNPDHAGLPRNILKDQEVDFTVNPPANRAIDPGLPQPFKSSPGHGTGTLCLLAGATCSLTGSDLGGVPFASILPIRISDYVWHLLTSVIPKGIRYAVEHGAQVISLSHGGLPTRAWADAVNDAYEAGVVICAATGDNYGGIPYRDVVWPARYPQVIGVAGVTYDRKPYYDAALGAVLEGNFGPTDEMGHVIAAWTPNVPWARCRDTPAGPYVTDGYDLDGGGTSASTPQVAAAVALYMQRWWPVLQGMPGWQRVEVVRAALRASADRSVNDAAHFGMGFLDALAMLAQDPAVLAPTVVKVDPSLFRYDFLTEQPGWVDIAEGERRMYELELTHLAIDNNLFDRVNAWQRAGADTTDPEFQRLRTAFLAVHDNGPSKGMRELLRS